jgi:hypothetical protein
MGVSELEKSIEIRQRLLEGVRAGHVLVPYHEADVTQLKPWLPTTTNFNADGEPIPEPPDGRVIGTQDADVAIFAAITGYMGPVCVTPPGSARLMQRVNRFATAPNEEELSPIYRIAALSHAGKVALLNNEASRSVRSFVYLAEADQFETRPGLYPFMAAGVVAVQGGVEVSSRELSIDPYELPSVEAIDWGAQAGPFEDFIRKAQV